MHRLTTTGLAMILFSACQSGGAPPPQEDLGTPTQNATVTTAGRVEREMAYPPGGRGNLPPSTDELAPPTTSRFDSCPNEKPMRNDWTELMEAKEDRKNEIDAHPAALEVNFPDPTRQQIDKQRAFSQYAATILEQLNALPPDKREEAYAEIKREFMGE